MEGKRLNPAAQLPRVSAAPQETPHGITRELWLSTAEYP